ncbi:hypothetical protein CEC48_02835 [Pseudomonas sp. K2I15]|nr:hypothetical protein CEC48_02835 [Pseudomonas sp. K2I15]
MLAKVVNDNAPNLNKRGVLTFFASKLAPTRAAVSLRVAGSTHPTAAGSTTATRAAHAWAPPR